MLKFNCVLSFGDVRKIVYFSAGFQKQINKSVYNALTKSIE
jgi:hypothetical protein